MGTAHECEYKNATKYKQFISALNMSTVYVYISAVINVKAFAVVWESFKIKYNVA